MNGLEDGVGAVSVVLLRVNAGVPTHDLNVMRREAKAVSIEFVEVAEPLYVSSSIVGSDADTPACCLPCPFNSVFLQRPPIGVIPRKHVHKEIGVPSAGPVVQVEAMNLFSALRKDMRGEIVEPKCIRRFVGAVKALRFEAGIEFVVRW